MGKYIFFDIDDTLVETSKRAYKKHCWICDFLGLPCTNKEQYFSFFGKKSIEEMAEIFIPSITVENYLNLYRESGKVIQYAPIYKNIDKIFSGLQRKGYKIGILTNGTEEKTIRKIDTLNITKYCSNIFHSGNLPCKKPNSLVIDVIRSSIGENIEKLIYVGDALEDYLITVGKKAVFYAVLTGYTKKQIFIKAGLDQKFIYPNINSLLYIL